MGTLLLVTIALALAFANGANDNFKGVATLYGSRTLSYRLPGHRRLAHGVPVSTTHVTCGSLFGIGLATREGRGGVIGRILLSWVITLPLAALLAALAARWLGA